MEWVNANLIPLLALAGGALGGSFSLYIWWRTAKTRRAEWLYALYSKFYEDSFYKKMRLLLDYRPAEELAQLYRGLEEGCHPELCEQLVDYLNFFEFIAGLWNMRQLTLPEIRMLFEYYLKLLTSHPPIMTFIESQSFENLLDLLKLLSEASREPTRS